MGLLDILNGMQNGPRGSSSSERSGGMSPMTMALLGVLAYKAFKKFTGDQATAAPANRQALPGGSQIPDSSGGGLSDLLKGGLGGLLAGGAAGSILNGGALSGGLSDLLKQFQQNGQGDTANSWVGRGENKAIAPNDLANALGADQIETLSSQTGLSREELLSGLSRELPDVVDRMTPDGRLPTEQEASRWI